MNLSDIKEYAGQEAESGNWKGAANKLNAITATAVDSRPWTIGDLASTIGQAEAAIVAYTIEKAGVGDNPQASLMRTLLIGISTSGVSLHSPDRQAAIDNLALAGGWPAELTKAVKEAGVKTVPRFDPPVTEQDVKTLWEESKIEQRITNAVALARERIGVADTWEQRAAKWTQAWTDSEV